MGLAVTQSLRRGAVVLAAAVLIGIGIGTAAKVFGIHPTRVASNSMSPAIHRDDWIVVRDIGQDDRLAIRRQDIVLFRFPLGTAGRAVKRVVALGGDTVTIGAQSVSVNAHIIPIAGAPSEGAARPRVEFVPEGHVFLLGDNAAVSIDSRSLGPVPETEIVGRVLFILPRATGLLLLGVTAIIAVVTCGLLVARQRRRG